MAEESTISAVADGVEHKLHDLSSAAHSHEDPPAVSKRRSVHQILGGGKSADVLLWRQKRISGGVLVGATVAWFLFEVSGYTFISILSNALLFTTVILFVWANLASLLNSSLGTMVSSFGDSGKLSRRLSQSRHVFSRSPPPIPRLELSEEFVSRSASVLREELNKTFALAYDVAIGKDYRVFLKVVAVLWMLSKVGGWFSFLTLLYIGLLAAHTVPVLYERYENEIDKYINIVVEVAKKQYAKIDELVISRVLGAATKEKKVQ